MSLKHSDKRRTRSVSIYIMRSITKRHNYDLNQDRNNNAKHTRAHARAGTQIDLIRDG